MLTLCINTALPETSIALLDDAVLGEESWFELRSESRRLLPGIESLITRCGKTVEQVNRIAIIKGPGIFTGLRIGVTVANAMVYARKAHAVSFNTLTFLKSRVSEQFDGAVILQTAPDVFFCAASDATTDEEIERTTLKKIQLIRGPATGFISPETKKLLSDSIYWIEPERSFGETMRMLLQGNEEQQNGSIVPLYIREPGITKQKKR